MKIKSRNNRGFTMIELMVVIIIVGIIASIVLVSISNSRKRGIDGAIVSNMMAIRSQAEIFYVSNSNRYWPVGVNGTYITGSCPHIHSPASANMFARDKIIHDAKYQGVKLSGVPNFPTASAFLLGSRCFNSATSYAIAIMLRTGNSASAGWKSWCIDSFGNSKKENFIPAAAFTIDPATNSATCK